MAIDVSVFRIVSGEKEQPSLYYNLYVSNLEDISLQYVVEYWHRATFNGVHIAPSRFRDVERTFSPQPGVVVATHGFALAPHETAVITLRASDAQSVGVDIAGHVRLRVPRVRPEGNTTVRLGAQAGSPVKVMLQAETVTDVQLASSEQAGFRDRDGYVVGRFGSVGALSNLRTAVGLALASGRALNEIAPDGSFVIDKQLLAVANRAAEGALPAPAKKGATQDVADEDRAGALLELLAELGGDGDTIREVNRILSGAGVDVEIAARQR